MEGIWKMEVALRKIQWIGAGWKAFEGARVWKMGRKQDRSGEAESGEGGGWDTYTPGKCIIIKEIMM